MELLQPIAQDGDPLRIARSEVVDPIRPRDRRVSRHDPSGLVSATRGDCQRVALYRRAGDHVALPGPLGIGDRLDE